MINLLYLLSYRLMMDRCWRCPAISSVTILADPPNSSVTVLCVNNMTVINSFWDGFLWFSFKQIYHLTLQSEKVDLISLWMDFSFRNSSFYQDLVAENSVEWARQQTGFVHLGDFTFIRLSETKVIQCICCISEAWIHIQMDPTLLWVIS